MTDSAILLSPVQGWATHARDLTVLGVPLIGSNVASYAIHLTDVVMLGWYDIQALAAVTLATSLYFVVFLLGAGFGWAVMPMVASAVAKGDQTQARRVTRMGMWLSAAYGLACAIPMLWSEQFFLVIGQDPAIAALAHDYLAIAGWGLIPGLMAVVLRSFLAALERTAIVLWATIGAAIINAIFGYALIFGAFGLPELGLVGAAWAALVTTCLSGLIMLAYALRAFPDYRLAQRLWRPDPVALRQVFRLGAPIGLTSLAEGGMFSACAIMVGWIGAVPLAAHGIAMQLASGMFMFHLGISQAGTIRAGQAVGRRDEANLRRTGAAAIAVSGGFALLTVLIFFAFPQQLVGFFVAPDSPSRAALLQAGVALLLVAAVFQLLDAMQVVALGLLRGVQDTAVPMVLAAISYWLVGIPSGYLLGVHLGWGAPGIWLGLVIGLGLAASLLMARFWTRAVKVG